MNLFTFRIGVALAVASALLLAAPVCSKSGGVSVRRAASYTVAQNLTLNIVADNTTVNIRSSMAKQVDVAALLYNSERIDYVVQPIGSGAIEQLIVSAKVAKEYRDRASAVLDLLVPTDTKVEVMLRRGDISISGPIKANGILITENGHVRVEKAKGSYYIETQNGDISVENLDGSLKARSEVGAITVTGTFAKGSTNRLKTLYGDVEVGIAGEPNISLIGTTENGLVKTSGTSGLSIGDKSVSGAFGSGDAAIDINVRSGSIMVKKLP